MCVSTNSWRHVSPQPSTPATLPSSNCRPGRTSVICNEVCYRSFPAAHGQLRLSFSWRYLFKVLAELVFFLLNLREKNLTWKKDTLSGWCLVERGCLKCDQRRCLCPKRLYSRQGQGFTITSEMSSYIYQILDTVKLSAFHMVVAEFLTLMWSLITTSVGKQFWELFKYRKVHF